MTSPECTATLRSADQRNRINPYVSFLAACSLRRQETRSIPWIVIVDAGRRRLATSDAGGGNIGYPRTPAAIEHFKKMLRQTARKMTDEDIQRLVEDLSK